MNIMICMLCLGDTDDANDELIECDGCGIVVHEDCYKVVDSIFLSSGASSSSTDAWFCEPCLAGVRSPVCELCPTPDGVFKRTDNNRWVHLLCALYTSGVAFNDPDNLMEVTLTELPQKQWSLHECSLCEDRFFAWTGVCISCDAGLCRTFFHVSCAQKSGLLSEPIVDETSVDPFFAHCRQHTDSSVARHRRRNFVTAFARLKKWRLRQKEIELQSQSFTAKVVSINEENCQKLEPRIQRKLENYRFLYENLRRNREKPYVPTTKNPLFFETSPVALKLFVLKAKALNLPIDLPSASANTDSSTPGYPVFTSDFVNYFCERERKITEFIGQISTLQNTQRELQISEASASHGYNSVTTELTKLTEHRADVYSQFCTITDILKKMIPELKFSDEIEKVLFEPRANVNVGDSINLPESEVPKFGQMAAVAAAAKRRAVASKSNKSKGSVNSGRVDASTRNMTSNQSSDETKFQSENVILECYVCHGLQDQHLITSCDTCSKAFHLACLDPPLLRMPKRTRLYGWQCSYCTKEVESATDVTESIDVNAPRQLRRSMGKEKPKVVDSHIAFSNTNCHPTLKVENIQNNLKLATVNPVGNCTVIRKIGEDLKRAASVAKIESDEVGATNNKLAIQSNQKRKCVTITQLQSNSLQVPPPYLSPSSFVHSNTMSYPSVVVTDVSTINNTSNDSGSFKCRKESIKERSMDVFKFDDGEKSAPSVRSVRSTSESDEELAQLRASKVIKFVQIRDHESDDEAKQVECIAPIQQRYIICHEGSNGSSIQRRSTTGKFKMKIKKL